MSAEKQDTETAEERVKRHVQHSGQYMKLSAEFILGILKTEEVLQRISSGKKPKGRNNG